VVSCSGRAGVNGTLESTWHPEHRWIARDWIPGKRRLPGFVKRDSRYGGAGVSSLVNSGARECGDSLLRNANYRTEIEWGTRRTSGDQGGAANAKRACMRILLRYAINKSNPNFCGTHRCDEEPCKKRQRKVTSWRPAPILRFSTGSDSILKPYWLHRTFGTAPSLLTVSRSLILTNKNPAVPELAGAQASHCLEACGMNLRTYKAPEGAVWQTPVCDDCNI